jgi:hypothetical protein
LTALDLEILLAATNGESGTDPAGDILTPVGEVTITDGAPTAGHPKMIMARVAALENDAATEDERRYWDSGDETEKTRTEVLQQIRPPTWVAADTSLADEDPNSVATYKAAGFQPVALLTLTGGGPAFTTVWQYMLPATGTRQLTSIVQVLRAIISRLAAIMGSNWYAVPAANLVAVNAWIVAAGEMLTAIDEHLTTHDGQIAVLQGADTTLSGRLDALEAYAYHSVVFQAASQDEAGVTTDLIWGADGMNQDPSAMWSAETPEVVLIKKRGVYDIKASADCIGKAKNVFLWITLSSGDHSPRQGAARAYWGVGATLGAGTLHSAMTRWLEAGTTVKVQVWSHDPEYATTWSGASLSVTHLKGK